MAIGRAMRYLSRVRTPSILGGYHSGWGWLAGLVTISLLAAALITRNRPWFSTLVYAMPAALVLFISHFLVTTRLQRRSERVKQARRSDAPWYR
mgnify:FL=1